MSHSPEEGPPPLLVVVSSRSPRLEDEQVVEEQEELLPDGPPPALMMPVTSTLESDDAEIFDERLFDLGGDIYGEEPEEATRLALELCLSRIPCEAARVFYGTSNDDGMLVLASFGSVAASMASRVVAFGTGEVGACFATRRTMSRSSNGTVTLDLVGVESTTEFVCFSDLLVPILDDNGLVYGVIELLNPTSGSFLDEDEEAVEKIARVLGNALAIG